MKIAKYIQDTFRNREEKAGSMVIYLAAELDALSEDLKEHAVSLEFQSDSHLHDRRIRLENGWIINIGKGFDIYQQIERPRSGLGMNDFDLRPLLETMVDILRETK